MIMEKTLITQNEIKQYSIDWNYHMQNFLFRRPKFGNNPNSPHTYRTALQAFFRYMQENHITIPLPDDVLGFIGKLRGTHYSQFTICLYSTVLKMFFAYLDQHVENGHEVHVFPDICKAADIRLKRPKKVHTRDRLTYDEIHRLKVFINSLEGQKGQRDRLLTKLSLYGGLRICELSRLQRQDMVQDGNHYKAFLHRKGRSSRRANDYVFIPKELFEDIEKYSGEYNLHNYIFTGIGYHSTRSSHLTAQRISDIINGILKGAGIKRALICPHSLRHTYASEFIRRYKDVYLLKDALGHSDVNTTLIYLHEENRYRQLAPVIEY